MLGVGTWIGFMCVVHSTFWVTVLFTIWGKTLDKLECFFLSLLASYHNSVLQDDHIAWKNLNIEWFRNNYTCKSKPKNVHLCWELGKGKRKRLVDVKIENESQTGKGLLRESVWWNGSSGLERMKRHTHTPSGLLTSLDVKAKESENY